MRSLANIAGLDSSRRRLLGALLALAIGQAMPVSALAAAKLPDHGEVDLDTFIRLSELLSGVGDLDRETAQKILGLIREEPWGKEHLAQISAKLLPDWALQPLPVSRDELFDPKRFGEGELWFIGHLLTTWYTGIYYHQRGNFVVTYRDALMFVALKDVRPIPGHCDGTFGFWSMPPAGAHA